MTDYQPLYPELYSPGGLGLEAAFEADFQLAVQRGAWEEVVHQVHPGLFTLRPFRLKWCEQLAAELDHRREWALAQGQPLRPPNSLHEYGCILAQIGLGQTMDVLASRVLAPLGRSLFSEFGAGQVDGQHSFAVEYARDRDEDLGFHVDDSEVTLNLCLQGEFQGSELIFEGARCDEHRQTACDPSEWFEYDHEPGVALVHAGKHRHRVETVRRGRRINLIVWGQSSRYRMGRQGDRHAETPWCGYRN